MSAQVIKPVLPGLDVASVVRQCGAGGCDNWFCAEMHGLWSVCYSSMTNLTEIRDRHAANPLSIALQIRYFVILTASAESSAGPRRVADS